MNKQQWIEAVMQSAKGQEPAESNPFLYTRVLEKVKQPAAAIIPVKWVYALSACLLVLAILNLGLYTNKPGNASQKNIDNVISEYGIQDNALQSLQQ